MPIAEAYRADGGGALLLHGAWIVPARAPVSSPARAFWSRALPGTVVVVAALALPEFSVGAGDLPLARSAPRTQPGPGVSIPLPVGPQPQMIAAAQPAPLAAGREVMIPDPAPSGVTTPSEGQADFRPAALPQESAPGLLPPLARPPAPVAMPTAAPFAAPVADLSTGSLAVAAMPSGPVTLDLRIAAPFPQAGHAAPVPAPAKLATAAPAAPIGLAAATPLSTSARDIPVAVAPPVAPVATAPLPPASMANVPSGAGEPAPLVRARVIERPAQSTASRPAQSAAPRLDAPVAAPSRPAAPMAAAAPVAPPAALRRTPTAAAPAPPAASIPLPPRAAVPALAGIPRTAVQPLPPAGAAQGAGTLAIQSQLLARIDGKTAGKLDFQQTATGLSVRLGSLAEIMGDRIDPAMQARIRASSSANAFLPLAELQAQGIPISYDPVYDEFNIGKLDTRPKAARKVMMDQISTPERGAASVGIPQVPRGR